MSFAQVFQANRTSTPQTLSSDPVVQDALANVLAKIRQVSTRVSTVRLTTQFQAGGATYQLVFTP